MKHFLLITTTFLASAGTALAQIQANLNLCDFGGCEPTPSLLVQIFQNIGWARLIVGAIVMLGLIILGVWYTSQIRRRAR